jgi:hypothetical protein
MKATGIQLTIRILIFIFLGIALALLLIPTSSPNRPSPDEVDAVRAAAQYVLIYASENKGVFPTSISKDKLLMMDRFPSSVDPEALTFYLREDLQIQDTDSDTPIVSIESGDGHYVGFAGGFVRFDRDWAANQPEHTIRVNAPGSSRDH